jgi:hypothetical protein
MNLGLILQPWLAGIFAGTLFWVQIQYLTHILPGMINYLIGENITDPMQ